MAEMRQRAQTGIPQLRRWGREDVSVPATDTSLIHPWDRPEGRAWILEQQRRFSGVLARKGPLPLGEGWFLTSAQAESDAVVLRLSGHGADHLEIGLCPPAWVSKAMARTERYALWVRSEGFVPDPVQDRVLKRLCKGLGLLPSGG